MGVLKTISILILLSSILVMLLDKKPRLHWSCSIFNYDCPTINDISLSEDSTYDPKFETLTNKFKQNFVDGLEVGAQLSVFYKGKNVVNIAAGYYDYEKTKKYDLSTNQLVFSISKVVSSLVISILVDRKLLNFEDLVVKYWPEFGKLKKEKITIAELINHRSGLLYPNRKIKLSELQDHDELAKFLEENVEHAFDGIPKQAYSSLIGGYFVNEIVRRVDPKHRNLGVFVEEEINKQLGVNLNFLITEEFFEKNVSKLHLYPSVPSIIHIVYGLTVFPLKRKLGLINDETNLILGMLVPSLNSHKAAFMYEKDYLIDLRNDYESHSFLNSSAGMKTNAYSIAKLAALISNYGELDGIRLISKETVIEASKLLNLEYDEILEAKVTRSLNGWAYAYKKDDLGIIPDESEEHAYGWGGFGGSACLWSYEKKFSFAYTMNAMGAPGGMVDRRPQVLLYEFFDIINNMNEE